MFRYKLYIWSDVAKCYRPCHGLFCFRDSSNCLLILKQLYVMHQVGFFLPFLNIHTSEATGYSLDDIRRPPLALRVPRSEARRPKD